MTASLASKLSISTIALSLACSSVSESDSSYWEPSRDLGGKDFPGFGAPTGGTSGDGAGGTGNAGPGGNAGAGGSSAGQGGRGAGGSNGGTGPGGDTGAGGDSGTGAGAVGGSDGAGGSGAGGTGAGGTGAGGTGAGGMGGTGAGGTGQSTTCALSFKYTTATYRGRFSPKYVIAVWIMNSQNQFMKTLEAYAGQRAVHLTNWNTQARANRADAVSGATITHTDTRYNPHTQAHWDCRDNSGNVVPNGEYTMVMELTEDDSAFSFGLAPPKLFTFPFKKGSGPQTITPPDQPTFKSMTLTIE